MKTNVDLSNVICFFNKERAIYTRAFFAYFIRILVFRLKFLEQFLESKIFFLHLQF